MRRDHRPAHAIFARRAAMRWRRRLDNVFSRAERGLRRPPAVCEPRTRRCSSRGRRMTPQSSLAYLVTRRRGTMPVTDLAERPDLSGYELADRFRLESGRVFVSGVQALARMPIDQLRIDRRRGRRTAAFVSGYQGSPVGTFQEEASAAAATVPDLPVTGEGDDLRFTGCVKGKLKSWVAPFDTAEPGDAYYGYTGPGYVEEFWILDVEGTRLMIAGEQSPGSPAQDIAERDSILDSIRIEP